MTLGELRQGDRIQLHPSCDAWVRGARYGKVLHVGSKLVQVKLDLMNRTLRVHPEAILEVIEP